MTGVVYVVGLGNELAGDDAAGVIAAKKLRHSLPVDVHVESRDKPDWEMFERLGEDDILIVIDAIMDGASAGKIHHLSLDDIAGVTLRHCSSHGLGLAHWAALAAKLGRPVRHTHIIGIEIAQAELGSGLSRKVEENMPRLLLEVENTVQQSILTTSSNTA